MSLLTTGVTLAAASSLLTLLLLIATVPVIFNELKDAEALFGFEMGLYKSDSNNIWQDLLNEQNWIKPEIIKYMKREANTEEVMQLRNTNFSKKCPYGPPGEPGLPGTDGEPGEEGEPGRPGKAFDSPESDFIREFCPPCPAGRPGPPGYKGKRGPRGMMGQQGPPGRPGNDGLPGVIGEEGNPGYPGEPGMIGAKGLPGDDGIGFAKGLPGPKGEQGLPGMQGERGPPGERGEDAPPGPRGPEGPPGPKGETGQRGIPGETGENGLPGRDGHYCPCPNRSVSTINSKASKEENHLAKKQMTSRERADETLNDVKKETNTSNTVDIGKMNENEMENAAKNSLQEQASMDNSDIENKALNENAEETTDDAEDGDDNEYKDEPEVNDDVQQALARTKLPTTIPSLKKPITDDADAAQLPSEKFEMISDDDNEANEEALADDEKSDDETYAENQEYKSELEVVSNGRRAQNLNGGMQVVSERVDIASEFASNVDDDAKLKAKKRNEGKGEKKVNFIDSTATESNGNKRHHEIVPLEGFVIAPARPTMDTESSENPTRKLHIG